MRHVLRIMVGGCGQQKCHLRRFHSGHRFRIFQGLLGSVLARPRHVVSRTSKTETFSSTSTLSTLAFRLTRLTGLLLPVQKHFQFRKALVIRNATSATVHSRYVPDPSKQAIDLSWSFLRILPTCAMNTRRTWLFRGDFPTFPSNPCMAVHVHRFCKG